MRAMELTTILNLCHHHRGFVYHHTRFGPDQKSVEVHVRPRAGSAAVCSGCHRPAPGYDHLPERRFEFIPFWGILVFFLYSMWRVQCRNCGVVVTPEAKSQRGCRSEGYGPGDEECPRGNGQNYLRSAVGHAAVGDGGSHAKVILPLRIIGPDVKKAALLAVYAFREIKARVEGCGNATTAVCLKGNSADYVPWYLIQKAEQLFDWYSGIEQSAFQYVLGHFRENEEKRHRAKMSTWLRKLKQEFDQLASELLKDPP